MAWFISQSIETLSMNMVGIKVSILHSKREAQIAPFCPPPSRTLSNSNITEEIAMSPTVDSFVLPDLKKVCPSFPETNPYFDKACE